MTAPNLRRSPSGPDLPFFLTSDDVGNVSTIPGTTLTDAMDVAYERRINYLDQDDDPITLWNFEDTLAPVVGPAFTSLTGQYGFTDIWPGARGLFIGNGSRLEVNVAGSASLRLLGAMSLEMIISTNTAPPTDWIVGCSGLSNGVAAQNNLWSMALPSNNAPRNVQVNWDTGAGVPVSFSTSQAVGASGVPPIHNLLSLGFSRTSGGIVQPYLNGRTLGAPSAALTLPTSGTSAVFTIGAQAGSIATSEFVLMSVAVYSRARPASEWLGSYNRSIGNGLGFITEDAA